jgi:hypothetical protein
MSSTICDDQLNESLLVEIFSFLPPSDITKSVYLVSKQFHHSSRLQLKQILRHFHESDSRVEIIGLQSLKGKSFNGKIGSVGKYDIQSGRFDVDILQVTGETIRRSIKGENMSIYTTKSSMYEHAKLLSRLEYSDDATLRKGHDSLYFLMLMVAKTEVNRRFSIIDYPIFEHTDKFHFLPHKDKGLNILSEIMWRKWTSSGSSVSKLVLPIIFSASYCKESSFANNAQKANWKVDGLDDGKLMIRNFYRFMRSWEKECITGYFWIASATKTGTLMIKFDKETGEYGHVYLVRGIFKAIKDLFIEELGDHLNSFPVACRTTILPMYDFLVFDGAIELTDGFALVNPYRYAWDAVANDEVIVEGMSSKAGLWDDLPPLILPQTLNEYADI